MKKLLLQILFACLPLALMAQSKGMVFFEGSFSEALEKAKQENKNVFVDCYTQWCGPCLKMATTVFPTEEVGNFMNPKFVHIQMDMEHEDGPAFAKKHKISSYPTFIIFSPDGKEIGRFTGFSLAKPFFAKVINALNNKGNATPAHAEMDTKKVAVAAQPKDTVFDEGKGVAFESLTYAQALEKAKNENKRIFIFCYTDDGKYSLEMRNKIFKDTRLGHLMNYQFINLCVDMKKDPDGELIGKKYDLTHSYPAYLILNPDGVEYNRMYCFLPVIDFSSRLTKSLMGEMDPVVKLRLKNKAFDIRMKKEREAHLTAKPVQTPATKIKFEKDDNLNAAIKKAKKLKRPVFIFVSDGGLESNYMISVVLQEANTADYFNNGFVNVFVDAKSQSGSPVMSKYALSEVFPGYIVLDGNGDLIGVQSGTRMGKNRLIESIKNILKSKSNN